MSVLKTKAVTLFLPFLLFLSLSVHSETASLARAQVKTEALAQAVQPSSNMDVKTMALVQGDVLAIEMRNMPAALQEKPLYVSVEEAGIIDYSGHFVQRWRKDKLSLRLPILKQRSESPDKMTVVLATQDQTAHIKLSVPVAGWPETQENSNLPFALLLIFAFIGGVILNLMPCVFPVLSLKMLSFAQHAGDRRKIILGGFSYTAGVIISFVFLATLLILLREGGEHLGWGFQLQSPIFVAGLAILFTLLGFNLMAFFEIGSILPNSVASFRAKHPIADDALSGILAVAIASPCTAPFMGVALGAALTLPIPAALTVFAVLGLGMAAPYLAGSIWPGVARLLPKPGSWMAKFKTLMAFPMFATVVWLIWVLGQQVGINGITAVLGVLVALTFMIWTLTVSFNTLKTRAIFRGLGLIILIGTLAWSWPALRTDAVNTKPTMTPSTARWQPWSEEKVEAALREKRPVFIDFTAAWCITCQFNKRTTLANKELLAEFGEKNVLLLRADWTNKDPAITKQLTALGRSGVPTYALYGPSGGKPQLLSEILSVTEVRDAIAKMK